MKFRRIMKWAGKLLAVCLITCLMPGCAEVEETVPEPTGTAVSSYTSGLGEEGEEGGYIYNCLSEKEREYYRILRDAVRNFEEEAVYPEALPVETLRKLFVSVYYGEYDIFWLDSIFFSTSADSRTQPLRYRFTPEEVNSMQKAVDEQIGEIFAGFDSNTTDYKKVLAFHDRLVLGCRFDESTVYSNTIYGALVNGTAQCEGYAFSFEYLCKEAGIECFTVTGTNSGGDLHAWNMVNIDGMWYHVDCTWDDPILESGDPDFLRYYYFLACDSDIIGVTHIPDNTYFTYPSCTSRDNYYKREGCLAQSGEEGVKLLKAAAVSALESGRKNAAVRFTDKKAFDSAYSKLFDSKEIRDVFGYVNSVSTQKIMETKYVRYSNEDELIIHISMIYDS